MLIPLLALCGLAATATVKAQQDVRDQFLVETISRYSSPSNHATAEYEYDAENKL